MALDLTAIRTALAEQISQGTGREVRGYPYPTGAPGDLPCVIIRSAEEYINYHVDLGHEADVNLIVDVMARCSVALEDGLLVLDELLSSAAGSPISVIDAIEADLTLGGVVEQVTVGSAGQQIGFNGEDGRREGVLSSVPVQVWVARS